MVAKSTGTAALQLAGFRLAVAELGAEAVHPVLHLQVVDAAVGHVVEQHDVDLRPLLQEVTSSEWSIMNEPSPTVE